MIPRLYFFLILKFKKAANRVFFFFFLINSTTHANFGAWIHFWKIVWEVGALQLRYFNLLETQICCRVALWKAAGGPL